VRAVTYDENLCDNSTSTAGVGRTSEDIEQTMPGVLEVNTDLPIKTDAPVHFGKVRAVYWLTAEDSARLIKEKSYDVAEGSSLAVMVISDRISAFDCVWRAEENLNGVPGKVRERTNWLLESDLIHGFEMGGGISTKSEGVKQRRPDSGCS